MHPRKSGPVGAPCFGQFGDGITISERLGGALGTTRGCGFPVATRAAVGPSEPSSLAVFLGPVPRRLVLSAPSELLRELGSSSTSRTFFAPNGAETLASALEERERAPQVGWRGTKVSPAPPAPAS